tara:strand:+ start:66833 stop:67108 length:276 start_codon:yes stop_codon:yes gene_type:complete
MIHSLKTSVTANTLTLTGTICVPKGSDIKLDVGEIKKGVAEVHVTTSRFGKSRVRAFEDVAVNCTIVTTLKVEKLRIIVNRCELGFYLDVA